jgi:hypothetical protein
MTKTIGCSVLARSRGDVGRPVTADHPPRASASELKRGIRPDIA